MVVKHLVILVVLSFLIICSIASAQNPDILLISSDRADTALIANGHDSATITVSLLEGGNPVSGTSVNFAVVNPVLGTIDTAMALTDGEGKATVTFTSGITAGTAEIRADSSSLTNTTTQNIVLPIPDETSNIISNTEWLIANNSDRATITVYAYNTSPSYSNYPISGLQVQFSVNNSMYGSFNPLTAITNSEGIAQSTFSTGYRSGTALLYGNLTYVIDAVPIIKSLELEQKIDHDTPYRISEYNYTYRVEVGEITSIELTFLDRWGNPIDNRRIAEEVNFTVSSPSSLPKGAGFVDGLNHIRVKTVPVDSYGLTRVDMKTDEVPGWNYITIHPLMYNAAGNQAITDKSLVIAGIPGKPVRMEAVFNPADYRLPADGVSVFHISYTLWDKYDNYVQNRSVNVQTSIPGEGKIVGTTTQGQAVLTYGPKWSIGVVEITATALDNTSVTHSQQVLFIAQEATDVLFTASPQTMASLDVPGREITWLIATVVDEAGNPVSNPYEVTFGIEPGSVTSDKEMDQNPVIPITNVITDEYGTAMVEFLPGSFSTEIGSATGSCYVTATWEGTTRSIPVVWKNYPYMSVEAYASSNQVEVGDTVDVTVLLKGDGHKLTPPPIDVILCIDRSGSMLYDNPDRMHSVREAAKIFTDQLSPSRDRIGIVTFGRNGYISRPGANSGIDLWQIHNSYTYPRSYSGYATYDQILTINYNQVKSALDLIVPDHGTPMREALRLSIANLASAGRPNAVKAVVILSDGDYNWYGDPLARGSGGVYTEPQAHSGGSGGGGAAGIYSYLGAVSEDPAHGNSGGDGSGVEGPYVGGGGGGAGAPGSAGVGNAGGNGGEGLLIWGNYYAGGGGGGAYATSGSVVRGTGGLGGGGTGGSQNGNVRPTSGVANTGGGGGGAGRDPSGYISSDNRGGSGVVKVLYGGVNFVNFTTVGSHSWTVPAGVTSVDLLIVAGGGGGGRYGGGGAGGLIYQTSYSVTPGASIPVTVGAGGIGSNTGQQQPSSKGGNSSFGTLTAIGGGGGGGYAQESGVTSYGDLTPNYRTFFGLGEGQASNQNMSVYANNSKIKIYSIGYADTITAGGKTTLETLALGSGGKYYTASASDIVDVYTSIAGDLKTDAGVNTTANIDYNIILNYTTPEVNDGIFAYNYSPGYSTWMDSYFTDGTAVNIPGLPWNFDNTTEWDATKRLQFSLGTVRLYQVWEIRYRLVAQKEGFFNLFGVGSNITFQDADEPLVFPDLVLKVNPETPGSPVESVDLYYTQIEQNATGGSNPNFYVTFDIMHEYTGTNNVREDYYIVTYDGRRYYLESAELTPDQARQLRHYTILISRLPAGWKDLEPVLTEIGFEAPGPIIPAQPIPIIQGGTDPKRSYINLT